MPASRASSRCAATRRRAPPRATRSSATSRAPRSSCSSSTACRPSARRTPRRAFPGFPEPRTSSRAGAPRSRSPPSRTGTRARGIRASTSTRCWPSRRPVRRSRSPSCSSTPTTTSGFVSRSRDAGVTIPILPGIMPITSPGRLRRVLELSGEELPERAGDRPRGRDDGRGAGRGRRRPRRRARARGRRRRSSGRPPLRLQQPRHGARGPPRRRHPHRCTPEGLFTMTEIRRTFPAGTILGYPRIGRRRELKRAVESYWAGRDRPGRARGDRVGPAPRHARAPRGPRARPRRLVDPRVVLVLRPGARRRGRRRRAAGALRRSARRRRGDRARRVLHGRPRCGRARRRSR